MPDGIEETPIALSHLLLEWSGTRSDWGHVDLGLEKYGRMGGVARVKEEA